MCVCKFVTCTLVYAILSYHMAKNRMSNVRAGGGESGRRRTITEVTKHPQSFRATPTRKYRTGIGQTIGIISTIPDPYYYYPVTRWLHFGRDA